MTNKKQITQQAYNELQEKFDALKEEMNSYVVAEEESYGQWVPEEDEKYYFIYDHGRVISAFWYNCDHKCLDRLAIGNVYKTKEEAEAQVKYLKALTKVKNRIAELNERWVPVWGDNTDSKYRLYYNYCEYGSIMWTFSYTTKGASNSLHLKSEKLAKQLIKELPEELTLILRDS
jgi:hypothetical protein